MSDEAARRAREIVEGLLEIHGIVFTTPRSKHTVVAKLAELLEELPLHLAPPADMLAEWLVGLDEVADLFADDEAIERVATAAGARPRSYLDRPLLANFELVGEGWVAVILCDIGIGMTRRSVVFGEGRAPPSKEEIASVEEKLKGLKSFWPEIEASLLEHMEDVADAEELRGALSTVTVHVGPELAPRWSVQITLDKARYPDIGWIVTIDDWTIVDVTGVP
jgi:hypothetical protein